MKWKWWVQWKYSQCNQNKSELTKTTEKKKLKKSFLSPVSDHFNDINERKAPWEGQLVHTWAQLCLSFTFPICFTTLCNSVKCFHTYLKAASAGVRTRWGVCHPSHCVQYACEQSQMCLRFSSGHLDLSHKHYLSLYAFNFVRHISSHLGYLTLKYSIL